MTYTIEAKISNHLTMELCKLADEQIQSGMIEEATDNVISFHDLQKEDVQKAKCFIMEHFGFPKCYIAEEHYIEGFCELKYIDFSKLEEVDEEATYNPDTLYIPSELSETYIPCLPPDIELTIIQAIIKAVNALHLTQDEKTQAVEDARAEKLNNLTDLLLIEFI